MASHHYIFALACVSGLSLLQTVSGNTADADGIRRIYQLEHYSFRARNLAEAVENMDRSSPVLINRQRFRGSTHWQLDGFVSFKQQAGKCLVDQIDITLRVKTLLPKWLDAEAADESIKRRWARFSEALRQHEAGHAEFGNKAAAELHEILSNFPAADNCEQLQSLVDGTSEAVISRHAQADQEYDQQTQHGTTQGAVFP
ncbi:DUF922 domain-containing protein [Parachitinimonas caeni]|uniref:DUF922 domain-containing protein n=1 Tax=Parachitinimonas caeni TaxID=3031301 RepID=A0ABT7E0M1_9NEIS|nr:DUF922 domain-containing protein [Parachitinimonas caeni]MDK2125865.1 DUF922 domain-containing protein [Parachitinimonas caeni]